MSDGYYWQFRQWSFVADMNNSGTVTISDVWLWAKWLFFYPGDLVMYGIMQHMSQVAIFLEINPDNYGGIISGIISFMFYFLVVTLLEKSG